MQSFRLTTKRVGRLIAAVVITSTLAVTVSAPSLAQSETQSETPKLPKKLQCEALQTAGLHDYAGAPEDYEPSTFVESKFELRINTVLTRHLASKSAGAAEASPDLFLTMRPKNGSPIELRCRQIQGLSNQLGYSCTNTPPSELLLINPANLRFTRTSIGGWTFADTPPKAGADTETGANLGDDSLFVEYGSCN